MNILVVDDDAEILDLIKYYLDDSGPYNCITAINGQEALNYSSGVDIIITDWMMPKLSGIEFIKKIRQVDPFVYIIMITARTSKEDALHALVAGANDFVPKPFDISALETRLHLAEATIAINKLRGIKPV